MTAAQVVGLCRRLEGFGLTIWLNGGWGVDARPQGPFRASATLIAAR
jgi:hypothetical protein